MCYFQSMNIPRLSPTAYRESLLGFHEHSQELGRHAVAIDLAREAFDDAVGFNLGRGAHVARLKCLAQERSGNWKAMVRPEALQS